MREILGTCSSSLSKPSFLLYDQVAYFNLRINEVDKSFLDKADLLHFGGGLLAREPGRSTSLELARMARSRKLPTSFDVNVRPIFGMRDLMNS